MELFIIIDDTTLKSGFKIGLTHITVNLSGPGI